MISHNVNSIIHYLMNHVLKKILRTFDISAPYNVSSLLSYPHKHSYLQLSIATHPQNENFLYYLSLNLSPFLLIA